MSPAKYTIAVAAVALGGVGQLVRRRRSATGSNPDPAPPPLTTQSSPGQIADLQQAYGAEMAPPSGAPHTAGG